MRNKSKSFIATITICALVVLIGFQLNNANAQVKEKKAQLVKLMQNPNADSAKVRIQRAIGLRAPSAKLEVIVDYVNELVKVANSPYSFRENMELKKSVFLAMQGLRPEQDYKELEKPLHGTSIITKVFEDLSLMDEVDTTPSTIDEQTEVTVWVPAKTQGLIDGTIFYVPAKVDTTTDEAKETTADGEVIVRKSQVIKPKGPWQEIKYDPNDLIQKDLLDTRGFFTMSKRNETVKKSTEFDIQSAGLFSRFTHFMFGTPLTVEPVELRLNRHLDFGGYVYPTLTSLGEVYQGWGWALGIGHPYQVGRANNAVGFYLGTRMAIVGIEGAYPGGLIGGERALGNMEYQPKLVFSALIDPEFFPFLRVGYRIPIVNEVYASDSADLVRLHTRVMTNPKGYWYVHVRYPVRSFGTSERAEIYSSVYNDRIYLGYFAQSVSFLGPPWNLHFNVSWLATQPFVKGFSNFQYNGQIVPLFMSKQALNFGIYFRGDAHGFIEVGPQVNLILSSSD